VAAPAHAARGRLPRRLQPAGRAPRAEPWRRDGGSWIAPLAALQPATPDTPADRWALTATVQAAHPGRQGSSVELLTDDGQALTLVLPPGAALPAPGSPLPLALPAEALQWLPA